MDIVNPGIERYMADRSARLDEPVLLEMEAEGVERNFPIVGRNVGCDVGDPGAVGRRATGDRAGLGVRVLRLLALPRGRAPTVSCT